MRLPPLELEAEKSFVFRLLQYDYFMEASIRSGDQASRPVPTISADHGT